MRGIHWTPSHGCAWNTCHSRCWSEFIKDFGIGVLGPGAGGRHEIAGRSAGFYMAGTAPLSLGLGVVLLGVATVAGDFAR
jgi:hypothetical protein